MSVRHGWTLILHVEWYDETEQSIEHHHEAQVG
jgi:hypothetical protein